MELVNATLTMHRALPQSSLITTPLECGNDVNGYSSDVPARAAVAPVRVYGGMRIEETQQQLAARVAEIDELESRFKSGKISLDEVESIQRRLCELKGISFDDDDED
jgi:hypothetical protein